MMLSQESCWNDTTYRKYMQTNLDIYDEIHVPNYQCCLANSSIEAVFLTHYFIFLTTNDFGFSITFIKAVSSLKNVFLKCEHGAEFQPLPNILHQTFLTSNPGPTLYRNATVKKLNCVVKCLRRKIFQVQKDRVAFCYLTLGKIVD